MLSAFAAMPYTRGTTNTAAALNMLRTQMFTSGKGDRASASNVAIILTDGGSNQKNDTLRQASLVRRQHLSSLYNIEY